MPYIFFFSDQLLTQNSTLIPPWMLEMSGKPLYFSF